MSISPVQGRPTARIYYGWWVVAAAFLALAVEGGANLNGFGVFLRALVDDFGWSRAETSAALSVYWIMVALIAPMVGRLVDSRGPRRIMCFGAALLGLAFLLLSAINTTWQLYVGYLLLGIGATATAQVPAATVIASWFDNRRGLAMAITLMGIGFGGMVIPPLLSHINVRWGWRMSYIAMALAMLFLVLPVVALVIRTRPAKKELLHDGGDELASSLGESSGHTRPGISLAALGAVKFQATSVFWMVAGGFLLVGLGTMGIGTQIYAFLTDLNWSPGTAALAISLFGLCAIAGKMAFGPLADRVSPCHVAALCFTLPSAALALLFAVKTDPVVWLCIAAFGLGSGGIPLLRPLVAVEVFGMHRFGAVYGLIVSINSVGSVIGPLFTGYVFDVTRSYNVAFAVFSTTFALAALTIWIVRRRAPSHGTVDMAKKESSFG